MHEIYFVYPSQRVLHEVQMRPANEAGLLASLKERPLWRATDERRKRRKVSCVVGRYTPFGLVVCG